MRIEASLNNKPIDTPPTFVSEELVHLMGQFQGMTQMFLADYEDVKTIQIRMINDDGTYIAFGKEELLK